MMKMLQEYVFSLETQEIRPSAIDLYLTLCDLEELENMATLSQLNIPEEYRSCPEMAREQFLLNKRVEAESRNLVSFCIREKLVEFPEGGTPVLSQHARNEKQLYEKYRNLGYSDGQIGVNKSGGDSLFYLIPETEPRRFSVVRTRIDQYF